MWSCVDKFAKYEVSVKIDESTYWDNYRSLVAEVGRCCNVRVKIDVVDEVRSGDG